jgi:hypothetical protein
LSVVGADFGPVTGTGDIVTGDPPDHLKGFVRPAERHKNKKNPRTERSEDFSR